MYGYIKGIVTKVIAVLLFIQSISQLMLHMELMENIMMKEELSL